jgi:hypothetical protein
MKKAIALFVLGIFLAGSAFGAVAVDEDSVYVGEAVTLDIQKLPQGADAISKSGSDIVIDFNYGADSVVEIEAADTPKTLTTAEGGSFVVLTAPAVGGRVVTLPSITATNDGLWFKIGADLSSVSDGNPAIGVDNYLMVIRPYDSSETITYTSKILPGADDDKGKGIEATGSDSYPTIQLIARDGNWFVVNAKGTWAGE